VDIAILPIRIRVISWGIPQNRGIPVDDTPPTLELDLAGLSAQPGPVPELAAVGFDDATLGTLGARDEIVKLDLSGSPDVTDAGLATLPALPRLAWLGLGGLQQITDVGLSSLVALSELRWLFLAGCKGITDAGIATIANIPTLEGLHPCGCQQLGNGSLAALPRMPRLREVYISGEGFTDDGMAHVARCERLEVLGMDGPIGDEGYAQLAGHPALRALHLPACRLLTLDGLDGLARIPQLRTLAFYSTPRIDDRWLERLASFPALRELTLVGCPAVTDAGVVAFRQSRPEIELHGIER
jgi:hypothetical protein